jgi:hypothetical protein
MHLMIEHFRPSNREQVGEDEYGPPDLCGSCIDELLIWFAMKGKDWPAIRRPKEADATWIGSRELEEAEREIR